MRFVKILTPGGISRRCGQCRQPIQERFYGVGTDTARGCLILVLCDLNFAAHDNGRRGRVDSQLDTGTANLKHLDFDVVAYEKTLAGAAAHHEHDASSCCATSGCRWE